MKKIHQFAALAFLALAACTTQKTEPEPEPVTSMSVTVANESDATSTVNINLNENWQVKNETDWIAVSPLSGFSGSNEISISVNSSNENPREKVGYFDIILTDTDTVVRIYVIQQSAGGIELTSTGAAASAEGGELIVEFLATEDVTADFPQDWANIVKVETGLEDVVLEDGTTLSELKKGRVTLDVNSNSEAEIRFAELTLSCTGKDYSVTIAQLAESAKEISDWSTPFLRRSLAMRFTATWCGYCPMMASAYEDVYKNYPDRFVPFTIHAGSSDIDSENGDLLATKYKVGGYPYGVVNAVAGVGNLTLVSATIDLLTGLLEEAAEELPSNTAIAAETAAAGNMFYLHCSVATKDADRNYRLHAYIMEDGIVANQTSYYPAEYPGGSDYVHNYVERHSLTGTDGIEIEAAAQETASFNFEYDLSEGKFENTDNIYAVVFVTYDSEERFSGTVPNASYQNYGHIVDNATKVPLNGKIDYEYEK